MLNGIPSPAFKVIPFQIDRPPRGSPMFLRLLSAGGIKVFFLEQKWLRLQEKTVPGSFPSITGFLLEKGSRQRREEQEL